MSLCTDTSRHQANASPSPATMLREVEELTQDLAAYVAEVQAAAPHEPCDEVEHHNIPIREWRQALRAWCTERMKNGSDGDWVRGLAAALEDLEDDHLRLLLEDLGR